MHNYNDNSHFLWFREQARMLQLTKLCICCCRKQYINFSERNFGSRVFFLSCRLRVFHLPSHFKPETLYNCQHQPHFLCKLNILSCWSSVSSMFLSSMLTDSIEAVKLFIKCFEFVDQSQSCFSKLFGNVIVCFSLGFWWENK